MRFYGCAKFYEKFSQINKTDQAIFEAEKEVKEGAQLIPLYVAMNKLNEKYHG